MSPEEPWISAELAPSGQGATNLIRRFITSSEPLWERSIVQQTLLTALNQIFGVEGTFTEITIQHHEPKEPGGSAGPWEVYLGERGKGLIPLSSSGSGLKTIILVLLNLIAIPHLTDKRPTDFVFAFEELENNLHPSLLRRLCQFIEDYAQKQQATVFLTTHSNVVLDFFSQSDSADLALVTHNGQSAHLHPITTHFNKMAALSELGAKPSDLLQANGIVWLEGPSDRIYLNHWISLLSRGKYKEGREYQCALYGGALLACINPAIKYRCQAA